MSLANVMLVVLDSKSRVLAFTELRDISREAAKYVAPRQQADSTDLYYTLKDLF